MLRLYESGVFSQDLISDDYYAGVDQRSDRYGNP